MKIGINDWLQTSLGVSKVVSNLIAFGIVIFVVLIVWFVIKKILIALIPKVTAKTATLWDDIIFNKRMVNSLATLIPALLVDQFIPVIFKQSTAFLPFLLEATDVLIIIVSVWILNSFFSSINIILSEKQRYKDKPIGSLTQLGKILTFSVGAILVISTVIEKSPFYLLSGLGAMAAIILLVFKDSILGFVASIQLSANNMVQVGDWVTMSNYGADGDVLEINLTTIKVRNFDLTITTIPTYSFISDSFKNWRGMQQSDGRRIKRSLFIKQDTICFCDKVMLDHFEKIEYLTDFISKRRDEIKEYNSLNNIDSTILVNGRNMTNVGVFKVYVEEYLKRNANINQEMMIMVRQMPPTEKGLPLEIYAFSKHKEWKIYESVMADIFDHILAVIPYFNLQLFENPSGSDLREFKKK
jgi:miniconductance mechanosensitive channel